MNRKEFIETQSREHANRGIYDNSMCRTGMDRRVYAEVWQTETSGKIHLDLDFCK